MVGKTFQPDVNYFADWVTKAWTGGWTAAIFPTDFSAQDWFWTKAIYDACLASSISFYLEGEDIRANAVDNGVAKVGIHVEIDPEARTIMYSTAPFTFSFVFTDNDGGKGPWLYGAYDGANLSNINSKGMYLGFASGEDEVTMHHLVRKP